MGVLSCYHDHLSPFICGIRKQPSRSDHCIGRASVGAQCMRGLLSRQSHASTGLDLFHMSGSPLPPANLRQRAFLMQLPVLLPSFFFVIQLPVTSDAHCSTYPSCAHISSIVLSSARESDLTRAHPLFIHRIPPGQRQILMANPATVA